jgi:hypothetical protein
VSWNIGLYLISLQYIILLITVESTYKEGVCWKQTFHCIKQGSLVHGKCKSKFSVMEIKFTPAPDLVREQKHIQTDRKSFKFFSYALAFSIITMLPPRGRF